MFENPPTRQMNQLKCFEKIFFPTNYFLIFPWKVQNLTVFSIMFMIRIRIFGPRESIQTGFRAAQYEPNARHNHSHNHIDRHHMHSHTQHHTQRHTTQHNITRRQKDDREKETREDGRGETRQDKTRQEKRREEEREERR